MKENHIKSINEYLPIFIISALMGILGQTIIPWLSAKLNLPHFEFRFLISNIDIYPFVIVLLISLKNPEPKKVFWRILIYFIGLCLGYYGYTSVIAIYNALASGNINYLTNILSDLNDSLGYLIIAVLAGIWGFVMIKYKNKKNLYCFMLLPFILVSIYTIYSNVVRSPYNIFMIAVDVLSLAGIIICSFNKKFTNGNSDYNYRNNKNREV